MRSWVIVAPTRVASERSTASTSSLCNVGLNIFPHCRGWKCAQDADVLGDCSTLGNGPGCEGRQLLFGRCHTGLELNVGDRQFPGVGIGAADGRGQRYRGMLA